MNEYNLSEIILTEVLLVLCMTFVQLATTGILIYGFNNLSEEDEHLTCASEQYVTFRAMTHDPSLSIDVGRQCRLSFWLLTMSAPDTWPDIVGR